MRTRGEKRRKWKVEERKNKGIQMRPLKKPKIATARRTEYEHRMEETKESESAWVEGFRAGQRSVAMSARSGRIGGKRRLEVSTVTRWLRVRRSSVVLALQDKRGRTRSLESSSFAKHTGVLSDWVADLESTTWATW